jgi:PBSX family phage terminase large subunit
MDVINEYVPLEWQRRFHEGDWKFCCLVSGKGAGKTFAAIQELITCALEFPRTTYVIGRKTLPSLRDSSWKTFLEILDSRLIKEATKNPMRVELINGSEFLGRPLDEMKKFDSMEIAGFFVDEADEIDEDMWKTLKDRTRQIIKNPDGRVIPRYRGIISLNPTDEDHWIPQFFLSKDCPKDHKIYFASTLENKENLPPGYIEQLKSQYSPEMQQRLIYGMFGRVHKGRPVFPQFNRGNYVWSVEVEEDKTLFRSWDFGYNTPACVWFQFIDGQMRVLEEMCGNKEYIDDFAKRVLKHQAEMFPNNKITKDFCDPHGADEKDTGQTSVKALNELGIYPQYRRQSIAEGIKAIKWLLDTKNKNNEPNFYINGRCKRLVEGFRGGYHRLDGEEHPAKDGYYDHVFDCLSGDTLISTDMGKVRLDEISLEHKVLTSSGYREHSGLIRKGVKPTVWVHLTDGSKIRVTENHLFWVHGVGWVEAINLTRGDVLRSEESLCTKKKLYTQGLFSDVIQIQKTLLTEIISRVMTPKLRRSIYTFIGTFGKNIMGLFRTGSISTIKMEMCQITPFQILSVSAQQSTFLNTEMQLSQEQNQKNVLSTWRKSDLLQKSGIDQKKVVSGTEITQSILEKKIGKRLKQIVWCAIKSLWPMNLFLCKEEQNSVTRTVGQKTLGVERVSKAESCEVFDINVPKAHHFFANGVMVHNCLRYGATFMVSRFRFNQAASQFNLHNNVIIHPVSGRRIEI